MSLASRQWLRLVGKTRLWPIRLTVRPAWVELYLSLVRGQHRAHFGKSREHKVKSTLLVAFNDVGGLGRYFLVVVWLGDG